jgi:glucosylceramidase
MPIPKPALITSANGDFWNTTATPTAGGTSATITVDTAAEQQDWIGWGGTFNERGWVALMELDQAERDRVMKLLFSKVDGLGLNYGRIPMGASDYAIERYTLCDSPCDETNIDTTFSIDHDKDPNRGLIPFIKAAQAVVTAEKAMYAGIPDTKYWGSPWTPPPWMKDNDAYDKGVMRNEPAILEAYAKYFVKWVQAYQAEGIPIDHVYPQNEPGWAQAYPSCAWGPSTDNGTTTTRTAFLGTFAGEYLAPALTDAGLSTTVWYGTFSNGSSGDPGNAVFPPYWDNRPDASLYAGVGLQWAAVARVSTAISSGKPVMQSEHQCGNYPWLEGANNGMNSTAESADAADKNSFWAPYAPNNYNYGIESWELLKQWIDAGVNGYSAWNMVLDRDGKNLDLARPWPQNALISFEENGTVKVTPYYYVFRHLSQYVDPGAKRLSVTGGNALAFKNPDGSVATVIYNSGAAAQVTLSVGGSMVQFQAPANGWATVNTPAP